MVGNENVSCFSVSTKTLVFMNESKGNLKYREIKLYTNALRTFPLIYDTCTFAGIWFICMEGGLISLKKKISSERGFG
jgi:hypothetical protein